MTKMNIFGREVLSVGSEMMVEKDTCLHCDCFGSSEATRLVLPFPFCSAVSLLVINASGGVI